MKNNLGFNVRGRYRKTVGSAGERILAAGEKPVHAKQTAKKLLSYLKIESKTFLLVFLMVLISNLLTLAVPYLISKTIDGINTKQGLVRIGQLIFWMGVLFFSDGILQIMQGIMMAETSQKIIRKMREALFDKLLKVPMKYFDRHDQGDIMSRFSNDIDNISSTLSDSTIQFMNAVMAIFGSLVMMIYLNIPMTLTVILTLLLSILLTKTIASKTAKYFRARSRQLGEINGIIEESITGFEVVKLFSREEEMLDSFAKVNDKLRQTGYKAMVLSGFLMPLMNVINNLRMALIAFLGAMLVLKGYTTVGVIAAFISYSRKFNRPIGEIASVFNLVQSALAGAERVFQIIEAEEVFQGNRFLDKEKVQGRVEFKKIFFSYDKDHPVLADVSFIIEAGKKIALVGPTGAGKTTIINLLMKFYEPSSGEILIDGESISTMNHGSLRNVFGVVSQDPYLFAGTIRDNISYPDFCVEEARIIEASKAAGCHDFILRLPLGYDTLITESGSLLSQGEKQLITIARAIIKNPKILILDEATSSVDTKTELKIQSTLMQLLKHRTGIIIAHRLSTIKEADVILVVDDKKIIEMGSHEELLKRNGNYSKMYFSQFSA